MSNLAKKIFVAAVAAIVVATVAVPPSAQGQTVEELQAQISALLAQIQTLQAQLAAVSGEPTGGGVPGVRAGFQFNQNLTVGSTGQDVMNLQIALNTFNNVPIASSGPGSPGNETSYFGPITRGGVTAFQNKFASEVLAPVGLTSGTGFFGPSTRAKINALLTASPSPTPGTPSPTPGTPSPTPGISTPGVEGSITAKYSASPITGEDYNAGEDNVNITGVEVKATNSDVIVNRIDVAFRSRPWLNVSEIAIADGSTVVKTMDVNSSNSIENTVGTLYTVRVEGLNILVPEGTTKVLNVHVDPRLQAGESSTTVTYFVPEDGVRATDGAGLTQQAPSTAALADRTFVVEVDDVARLEVSEHSENEEDPRNVVVSETSTTENVTLLVASVMAKTNGAILREVTVNASGTVPANTVLKLYNNDTLLASESVSGAANATFDDLSVSIARDATSKLSVKADIPSGNEGTVASVSLTAASNTIVAEDATTFANVNVTGSDVTGGDAHLFVKAPTLALVSGSTTVTPVQDQASSATFTIRVNVTANGGDIYVASFASSGMVATSSHASATVSASSLDSDASEQGNGSWRVSNGQTKWFDVTGQLTNTHTEAISVRALIDSISWGETAAGATDETQTWGLEDLRTSTSVLQAQ